MATDEKLRSERYRLPDVLPIFPLASALLLPGCRLPLNIFEPRYLQMIDDVLEGDRMIGVIQPVESDTEEYEPDVQQIGCAGRVASIKEGDEGSYRIDLIGVCRFEVAQEIATDKLYRMVEPRWRNFASDIGGRAEASIDREELVANLKAYFETRGLEANWKAIDASGNEELVNSLAMVCPFDPSEKQALLEARDLEERGKLVIALMNMAVLWSDSDTRTLH